MSDDEGFKRKSRRTAAIEAAKRIKIHAEYTAQKYPLCRADKVTLSDSDNNMQRWRDHKQKIEDQLFDSIEMIHDTSNNISNCSDSPKSDDMPNKRRGRPPKSKSPKHSSRRGTNAKYKDPRCEEEDDYDVNVRRESYNNFLQNLEPKVTPILPGPKQLQFANGDISYRESLMRFTKGLGPIAQKVAQRMLQGQGLTNQAQHQLEPLFKSPDPLRNPSVVDVNSINDSVKNTITNQVIQPLVSLGDSNTEVIVKDKGKNVMVDDGKGKCNKWDVLDNLELLYGKQKSGVKIGNGPLENRDLGNRRTINQIGLLRLGYNGNLNQNNNKISEFEDIIRQKEVSWNAREGTPSNVKPSARVYPSTYVRAPTVSRPFSWVPQPPMHSPTLVQRPMHIVTQVQRPMHSTAPVQRPMHSVTQVQRPMHSVTPVQRPMHSVTPVQRPMQSLTPMQSPIQVQPSQNWCLLPPATTVNSVASDNIWKEQQVQLSLARNMQRKDQESHVWSRNLWAPTQENQFMQANPHGTNHQQPQDQLLMPMPSHFWSQMVMSEANPEQDPLPFGAQQDSQYQIGNHQLHPPPGI